MFALEIVAKVILCVFITDFLSGLLHWLEDAYGNEDWPITGPLITRPNILHHYDPRYFTRYSWLYSARLLLVIGAAILVVAYWGGFLNWMTLLVVAIGVNANEIHKWAHRTRTENGPVITFFQRLGVLQSPVQHGNHHRGTKDTYYCVITDYLNPLLEMLHFWPALEWLIYQLCGVRRRPDHSVKVEERGVYLSLGATSERQALAIRKRVANACRSDKTCPQTEIHPERGLRSIDVYR